MSTKAGRPLTAKDEQSLYKLTACDHADLVIYVFHFLRAARKAEKTGDTRDLQALALIVENVIKESK